MIDLFVKGGFMMYPILLCSVMAVGIIIERLLFITAAGVRNNRFMAAARKVKEGAGKLEAISKLAQEIPSPVSAIISAGIEHKDDPEERRNAVVLREGSKQRRELEQYVNTLGVISKITPLMGLLGTVIGMIRAFMMIQKLGGQVDATDLAGGISEALLTTAAGLCVAIPALIFYHFLESRIDNIVAGIKDSMLLFPEITGVIVKEDAVKEEKKEPEQKTVKKVAKKVVKKAVKKAAKKPAEETGEKATEETKKETT